MEVLSVILGVLLILVAIAIIGAVLLQSSKNARQSGVVSGGAEAFFGKSKGKAIDRKLNRITLILCLVFAALVITMYIVQPESARPNYGDSDSNLDDAFNSSATTTVVTTTTASTTTTGGSETEPSTNEEPATGDDAENSEATDNSEEPAGSTETPADPSAPEDPSAGEQ
ncbi:MAG: preprotein translocase subunit SecG [Clostridia bacterium]|nr:preprotein translocase subunit SecG [Clostridia bacterium]